MPSYTSMTVPTVAPDACKITRMPTRSCTSNVVKMHHERCKSATSVECMEPAYSKDCVDHLMSLHLCTHKPCWHNDGSGMPLHRPSS